MLHVCCVCDQCCSLFEPCIATPFHYSSFRPNIFPEGFFPCTTFLIPVFHVLAATSLSCNLLHCN